jgi:hypothetical protein
VTEKKIQDINEKETLSVCNSRIYLQKVNLNKQARVVIIPKIENTESKVNFTFKIGIEKRAIQLSDEKAKEMIVNLNKTIKKWEDINSKLGKVVEGMKGACFVTSALLQAKTLLEGFEGKSMARSTIMQGNGGWKQFCESEAGKGSYVSVDDCLLKNNGEIEKEVGVLADKIKAENARVQAREAGITQTDFFGQGTVDTAKSKSMYLEDMKGMSVDSKYQATFNNLQKQDYQSAASYNDLKDIKLYNDLCSSSSGRLKDISCKKLDAAFGRVDNNIKDISNKIRGLE